MKIEGIGGPEDGHTFRIKVNSRMASGIMGPGDKAPHDYTDADWWGPEEWTLEVRAWNLPDALRAAAEQPLTEWVRPNGKKLGDPEEPEEEPEPTCPRCGTRQWVSVSLNGGYTRTAQCVKCGHYGRVLGPGWKAGG
jgi:hypothetical protein